ncbi:MAG: hypothetical protein HY273_07405 [Gammaproteobacteria bacterium]|nr:hypothetical protein [Gammaproteobacteria bacterium]
MDNVRKLLVPVMSILFVVLQSIFTVNAEESLTSGREETQFFKELPKWNEIKPRAHAEEKPSVTIQESSQMRSPGARELTPIIQEQIERLGYREVSDDNMTFLSLDTVKDRFIPLGEIVKNTSSPLAIISIKTGIYKNMIFAGAIASGPAKNTGKWTQVQRYFSLENGSVLMLAESDYKAAEYSVAIPEELVNEKINGAPASMVVRKTTAGKYFTDLLWFTKNKIYSLHLTGRSAGVGIKNELIVFAAGVLED